MAVHQDSWVRDPLVRGVDGGRGGGRCRRRQSSPRRPAPAPLAFDRMTMVTVAAMATTITMTPGIHHAPSRPPGPLRVGPTFGPRRLRGSGFELGQGADHVDLTHGCCHFPFRVPAINRSVCSGTPRGSLLDRPGPGGPAGFMSRDNSPGNIRKDAIARDCRTSRDGLIDRRSSPFVVHTERPPSSPRATPLRRTPGSGRRRNERRGSRRCGDPGPAKITCCFPQRRAAQEPPTVIDGGAESGRRRLDQVPALLDRLDLRCCDLLRRHLAGGVGRRIGGDDQQLSPCSDRRSPPVGVEDPQKTQVLPAGRQSVGIRPVPVPGMASSGTEERSARCRKNPR